MEEVLAEPSTVASAVISGPVIKNEVIVAEVSRKLAYESGKYTEGE